MSKCEKLILIHRSNTNSWLRMHSDSFSSLSPGERVGTRIVWAIVDLPRFWGSIFITTEVFGLDFHKWLRFWDRFLGPRNLGLNFYEVICL